jgi:autotransporter-associated beta strand protein
MKPRLLNAARLSFPLATALAALLAAPSAQAATFTWTSLATPGDWTVAGNWSASTQFVSDSANELMFYSDTTTNIAVATRVINTNVPTALSMNTLTLNGKGASSGASSSTTTIGTSASTWTIGDGTTSTVNLNANAGASTAASIFYNVAANLTLNQATTLFTGNGTAGVHTNATDVGFVFSGNIGQAASGHGITKSGSSRLTLSGSSLSFTGDLTVNGGSLFLTGNSNPGFAMTVNTGATLRIGNNSATQLGVAGSYAGNISTGTGGSLQLWSTSAQTFSGVISGAGSLNKAYGGTLTLSGPNTYTGRTSFLPQTTAGFTVNVSSFNSVVGGTASSSLGAPTTAANGTVDLGSGSAQAGVNLTYTGASALGETTDRVINIGFNGTSDRTITANNASGVLRFTSAFTSNGGGQNGKLILTGTGAGQIDQGLPQLGALGLDKQGSGTWTLGGSGNFTGATLITAGTLSLSSATALRNSPFNTASVAGGAAAGLKVATTTLTLGALTGANALDGRFTTALGGPSNTTAKGGYSGLTALTLNNAANTTSTYSGGIVDGATGMTLTKIGAGTQFLTGTIGYTGLTSVNGGTLGTNATYSGAVAVGTSATLSPGASAGAFGTVTISDASASALTLNGGILQMDVSTASNDLVAVTGDTVLNGTNSVIVNPTTGVAAGTYNLVTSAATTGSGSVVFANGTTTLGDATLAVSAGNIQMTVGAGGLNHSVWVGTAATWDSGTNWNRNGTTASAFVAGDWVTIDDTGSNAAAITSAAAVSPASLTVNNSSKAFIINANIGGTGTPLIKSGTNTLTLGGTNTYSGGTVINGGVLSVTNNNQLGDTSVGITLAGGQLHGNGANYSMTRSVTVNGTGSSMRVARNNNITTSGALTGSGDIAFVDNGGSGNLSLYRFTSSGNTFTGAMTLGVADVRVSSLGDTLGNNLIFTGAGIFRLNDTGATGGLTFNNRAIELRNTSATIENLNTTHAITIGSNLVASGAAAKTLTLTAAAGPTNIFSGTITDGSGGGTVAVTKSNVGPWALSGTNTYSGTTIVGPGFPTPSTLIFQGKQAVSPNTTFETRQNSGSTARLVFLDDSAGLINLGNSWTFKAENRDNTSANTHIFVGNNSTANGGNNLGSTQTGSTIALGGYFSDSTLSTPSAETINITGANGYRLQLASLQFAPSPGKTGTTVTLTLNPTTAPVTIAGNVTAPMAASSSNVNNVLALDGTALDNLSSGVISDPTGAVSLAPLKVTKNNTSTWTLSGNNTYTGTTTVANNGTLILSGDNIGMTGGVTLSAGTSLVPKLHINSATALGTGTLTFGGGAATDVVQIDNSSAGAVTVSTANAITLNRNFTFIGTQDLNLGTGAVDLNTTGTALNRIITTTAKTLTLGGALGNTGAGVTGITKQGAGTLVLSGTGSSYTGNTTVSAGTLAVTGSLGATAVSVNAGTLAGNGNIGGNVSIASGATHSLAVAATPGAQVTRAITGTLTLTAGNILDLTAASTPAAGEYVLATATTAISGTPTTINYNGIPGTVTVDTVSNPKRLLLTVTGGTPYSIWAGGFIPSDVSNPALNFDSDSLTNLQEFAFGTNPTSSTGSLVYVNGGAVTTPGSPVLLEDGGNYYAVFGRRTTYIADGLTYNVQFSADLSSPWVTSGVTPTVLATGSGIDAVSVPFPGLIATDSGPQKARFFRVEVLLAP